MELRRRSLSIFPFVFSMIFISGLLPSEANTQATGQIYPGIQGSQMNWIDRDGIFLVSNNTLFGFGFVRTPDPTLFHLGVIYLTTQTLVWSCNRANLVSNSDMFIFDTNGNAYLSSQGITIWSTNSSGRGVSSMELRDSGDLVLVGNGNSVIWESFSHPSNTLLSGQSFRIGMSLLSDPGVENVTYLLKIDSGDLILSAEYSVPQAYWSMSSDNRMTINKQGSNVTSVSIEANSWKFYDSNMSLLRQFIFSQNSDPNATWAAVLGSNGFVSFSQLQSSASDGSDSNANIPADPCGTPQCCDSYYICSSSNKCQCPSALSSRVNCKLGTVSFCNASAGSTELVNVGDGLDYFALGFVSPALKTDLNGCKSTCATNCSCAALFFENASGNCYTFDRIGSLKQSSVRASITSYVKILSNGIVVNKSGGSNNRVIYIAIIAASTVLVISGLIYVALLYYRKMQESTGISANDNTSEEDNFLENLSGMPIRFSYKDLETATDGFTSKLGQGGFGSVYQGVLSDGSRVAVKKLEGIGQGKKEFRAEVSIIGSIHHLHLVKIKGFCAEGTHRLLAYEFMTNGSLDKWIFKKNDEKLMLDWDVRFNIALGTAKGLAYLHDDCDSKIVHCDIKPENVLLDGNFNAKVSDFGLAKLMTREQSHVFTTMRGTRGYLAPEWITNYAISEKSDVYSYGMLLFEIIGGRRNYDPNECSEKSHFPSYAFKMLEEGRIGSVLDLPCEDVRVERAIKVALWCIQEDMHVRPAMSKVVQMLEDLCTVSMPPAGNQLGSRLYLSSLFKSVSEEGTSSGPSDCYSDAYLSAVRLSGPR